jgi:hypothetical protein
MSTACRIKAPGRARNIPPPLRVHPHFDPDVHDLRLAMAMDSVRFRTDAKAEQLTLMSMDYGNHQTGPDACPDESTRECFAELALELGFRERSSESAPLFIVMGPLAPEEA